MENYKKVRAAIGNGSLLIDFVGKHPAKVISAAETAKLLDARPGVARALLAGLARDGVLERTERGRYRKGPQQAQGTPARVRRPRTGSPAPTPPGQQRRTMVLPEELVRVLKEALLADCDLSLVRDREAFIATLNDHHDGVAVAQNRTAELAAMDVVGKWQRARASR